MNIIQLLFFFKKMKLSVNEREYIQKITNMKTSVMHAKTGYHTVNKIASGNPIKDKKRTGIPSGWTTDRKKK